MSRELLVFDDSNSAEVDYFPQPVTRQPGISGIDDDEFTQETQTPATSPLALLNQLDTLIVEQKTELFEVMFGCERNNKYEIKDSQGQLLYNLKEESDCFTRNCGGPLRPFEMDIKDNAGRSLIHLSRPLAFQGCCCPCCLQTLEVFSPPGVLAGCVEEEWSFCVPKLIVKNAAGEVVFRIEGPVCTASCGRNVEFKIHSEDGLTEIGKISKHWSGLLQEVFTDADNFGIRFPIDLDVQLKAVLLGALFLIDFMFYEQTKRYWS